MDVPGVKKVQPKPTAAVLPVDFGNRLPGFNLETRRHPPLTELDTRFAMKKAQAGAAVLISVEPSRV